MMFHKGPIYDYHFIVKELADEFEGQFTYLGGNTKKYINFSVPIEKEVKRIVKNREEITKTISYKLTFINSAIFMASLLLNLVKNLTGGFHKIKYKYGNDNRNAKRVEFNTKIASAALNMQTLQMI